MISTFVYKYIPMICTHFYLKDGTMLKAYEKNSGK